jgi:hypothetical protein
MILTAGVAVVATLVQKVSLSWNSESSAYWESVADLLLGTDQERERQAEMTRRAHALFERLRRKTKAIADLIAGRTTLLRVAALFRQLQETSGEPDPCPAGFAGTKAEWYCRDVIGWVESELEDKPGAQKDSLMGRLNAELQLYLKQPGGVRLPETHG